MNVKKSLFTIYVGLILVLIILGIGIGVFEHTKAKRKTQDVAEVEVEEQEKDIRDSLAVKTEDIIKGDSQGVIKDGTAEQREAPEIQNPFVVTPKKDIEKPITLDEDVTEEEEPEEDKTATDEENADAAGAGESDGEADKADADASKDDTLNAEAPVQNDNANEASDGNEGEKPPKDDDIAMGAQARTDEPEILEFVDAYQEQYQVEINPDIRKHDYILDCFKENGRYIKYEGDKSYRYRLGIDVSHHDGEIDFDAVKESGIDFVIIRVGYRGYGEEGHLREDNNYRQYIEAAQDAGLDVGVYIFSQAINTDEAKEEAQLVLDAIEDYDIDLPVVYDPESVLDANARTDYVSAEQFTENTLAFCKMIEDAGYKPMIYCNMLWEAYKLDLSQLMDYPIWYADYEEKPQTPYYFSYWQYSNTGKVPGISGMVDLDIQLIPAD
ncbi:glycoside hydrolase family 25 protein [Butyrivibrio sp. AE3006]|uniref:glycoside hydrolase family 25 protein n=1 Tax=Butyrivibrio sp. AE3006 TaxID=1280673 RepID=UPI00041E7767|nr:glycoside hydrolase family 25 protein [Butyrivibrio sp. AE3006]